MGLAEKIVLLEKREEQFHASTSNCIGTALYLAGLREGDEYVRIDDLPAAIFGKYSQSSSPSAEALTVFGFGSERVQDYWHVSHAGIIFAPNGRLLLAHRKGYKVPFSVDALEDWVGEFKIGNVFRSEMKLANLNFSIAFREEYAGFCRDLVRTLEREDRSAMPHEESPVQFGIRYYERRILP